MNPLSSYGQGTNDNQPSYNSLQPPASSTPFTVTLPSPQYHQMPRVLFAPPQQPHMPYQSNLPPHSYPLHAPTYEHLRLSHQPTIPPTELPTPRNISQTTHDFAMSTPMPFRSSLVSLPNPYEHLHNTPSHQTEQPVGHQMITRSRSVINKKNENQSETNRLEPKPSNTPIPYAAFSQKALPIPTTSSDELGIDDSIDSATKPTIKQEAKENIKNPKTTEQETKKRKISRISNDSETEQTSQTTAENYKKRRQKSEVGSNKDMQAHEAQHYL